MLASLLLSLFIQDPAAWIRDLDAEDPAAREKATAALIVLWEDDAAVALVQAERRRAEADGRAESANRCSTILSRVEFRRALGKELLVKLGERGERGLYDGDDTALCDFFEGKARYAAQRKENGFESDERQLRLFAVLSARLKTPAGKVSLLRPAGLSRGSVPVFVAFLGDPDKKVIAAAIKALGDLKDRTCIGRIVPFLEDPDANVRAVAVEALSDLKATEHAAAIAKRLGDPEAEVRYYAIFALERLRAREQADKIAALLGDTAIQSDIPLRGRAASALAVLGAKQHAPGIAKILDSEYALARSEALAALGELKAVDFAPRVAELLKDEQIVTMGWHFLGTVRGHAARALGRMGARDYIPQIAAMLKTEPCDAAIALGDLGAVEYTKEVGALLYDLKGAPNREIIWALASLRAVEYSRDLRAIIRDRKGGEAEAARALGEMGAVEAVADIATLLESGQYEQTTAMRALGRLGAKGHAKRIAGFLANPFWQVRQEAMLALAELDARDFAGEIRKVLSDEQDCWISGSVAGIAEGPSTIGDLAARILKRWGMEAK